MIQGKPFPQQGRSIGRVSVLIEPNDGSMLFYKDWTGTSAKAIRKAVKKKYPNARLSFGCILYTNSYGAH